MALFDKKNVKKNYFSAATIVTEGTTSIGNFIGNDSIHIDGHVVGDIKVNNVVIIGKSGVVTGKIKAQQVISSGICNGDILCDSLELMEKSTTKGNVKSNKVLIKGELKGNIICSGLFISPEGLTESTIQAKNVSVGGTIIGIVACKALKILPGSCIKGKMFADRIINQGGHVEGFIGKYSDLLIGNPQLGAYASVFNSQNNTALLQHSDYHVNIEKEIQNKTQNFGKQSEEEHSCIDVEFESIDESKLFAVA